MRGSATLWVIDRTGALALPPVTIEVVGGERHKPRVQLNYVRSDGRTLRIWSEGPEAFNEAFILRPEGCMLATRLSAHRG